MTDEEFERWDAQRKRLEALANEWWDFNWKSYWYDGGGDTYQAALDAFAAGYEKGHAKLDSE